MSKRIRQIIREQAELNLSVKDEIGNLNANERQQIKGALIDLLNNNPEQEMSEIDYGGIPELKATGLVDKIGKWFKRFLTDKASDYLIDASAQEMEDTIKLIDALDPNDMAGIFTPRAMSLGGGIDFADDALS